jgi:hypothetical protein
MSTTLEVGTKGRSIEDTSEDDLDDNDDNNNDGDDGEDGGDAIDDEELQEYAELVADLGTFPVRASQRRQRLRTNRTLWMIVDMRRN